MRKLIDVLRQSPVPGSKPYHQVFEYVTDDESATVATALRELNARTELFDAEGAPAQPISWECSCLQKRCGACAMVVNGRPQAACDARFAQMKSETVTLEPLRKFPVVADLVVDRAAIFDRLRELESWLRAEVDPAALADSRRALAFEASRCLECGCCLEACPNFSTEGAFAGMAGMAPLARLIAETSGANRREHEATYRKAVFAGCGKSLACRNVCPAEIDIANLMARSNAASLWRMG